LNGKKEALTLETVPLLVKLLKDEDGKVRSKAALALEAIAITTEGKYSCIKEHAVENLVTLINDPISEARVNGLKAISCLAETPEGRSQLSKHIEKVSTMVMIAILIFGFNILFVKYRLNLWRETLCL